MTKGIEVDFKKQIIRIRHSDKKEVKISMVDMCKSCVSDASKTVPKMVVKKRVDVDIAKNKAEIKRSNFDDKTTSQMLANITSKEYKKTMLEAEKNRLVYAKSVELGAAKMKKIFDDIMETIGAI